jgi:hypothetical protein
MGGKMMLSEPHAIEAELFGVAYLLDRFAIDLGVALTAIQPRYAGDYADFHSSVFQRRPG